MSTCLKGRVLQTVRGIKVCFFDAHVAADASGRSNSALTGTNRGNRTVTEEL